MLFLLPRPSSQKVSAYKNTVLTVRSGCQFSECAKSNYREKKTDLSLCPFYATWKAHRWQLVCRPEAHGRSEVEPPKDNFYYVALKRSRCLQNESFIQTHSANFLQPSSLKCYYSLSPSNRWCVSCDHVLCTEGCRHAGVWSCCLGVKAGFTQDKSPHTDRWADSRLYLDSACFRLPNLRLFSQPILD